MKAINSLHNFNFNSSLTQLPLTKNPQNIYAANFSLLNVAETPSENSLFTSLEPLSFDSLSNLSLVNDFNELKSLDSAKASHAQMIKVSKKRDSVVNVQSLIMSYLEFGDFRSATMVFFVGFVQNYLYWNSFVANYRNSGGDPHEILEVFVELHNKGVRFGSEILTIVLKLCANLEDMCLGLEVHACLIKRGFDLEVYPKCALMNFYGKFLNVDSANKVFDERSDYNFLLWNEAVLVHLRNERWLQALHTFRDMQFSSAKANSLVIAKVLEACRKVGAFEGGKQIHGYVIRNPVESDSFICNSLISMYSKNDNLELARAVFDLMGNRNLSSWNSIISSYTAFSYLDYALELFHEMETSNVKPDIVTWNCLLSGHFLHGSHREVLNILRKMQIAGYKPNSRSITSVLQAVSELQYQNFGKEIHCYVLRNGLDYDLHVGTSLLDMYVKNDDLTSAQDFFDDMKNRNIFAWNSLISGYSFKGNFEKAVSLLNQMRKEGIKPDIVTYNSMISGYSMTGCIKEALATIREIKTLGLTPNVVSWTALISGCSQKGYYKDALEFCIQMQHESIKPNSTTIPSLLRACTSLSSLQKGREIHCFSIKTGFVEEEFVTTALIDMYSKCGSLKNAHDVFQKVESKTLASWNSMIMGLAIYGRGEEAISLFRKMQDKKIQPDDITFTTLLSSCKQSGLINEGWKYFDSMKSDYGIVPKIEHYSCMVDLLGRAGYLDEAWDFIERMPIEPDIKVWGALLGSCRIHDNLELGELSANKLFKLEPYNPVNYILMMNIYAASNRGDDVDRIKDLMDGRGVRIGNVWSQIQINQTVHVFSAVGKPHPDEGDIYFELYQIISEMKNLGYVPDTKCVHQKISEVEKQKVLLAHTEKLAIMYGLIKSKNKAPIRVIKNTRICSDCHTMAKYISLLRKHQIILKDGVRFHHFREGKCSCNDFW
ncbi:Pentatricopeptide repeat-containing protein [Forsythia ovata]|uniref:Pentatricopeptide repeat-containing protein n=1 Tax=Forsythia ovata TaxID=205694 RepID=A0ABD1VG77_9LAMI